MADQSMVEVVARAIFAQWRAHMDERGDRGLGARSYDALTEREKDFSLKGARAAIRAMREPTEEMLAQTFLCSCGYGDEPFVSEADGKANWHLMIDAALSEGVSK